MNPSPVLEKIFQKEALPKISVIVKIFSEYTGYTVDDPRLYSGIITLAAPFAVCLLGRHHSLRREMPVHIPIEIMAENIKQLALANLENLKRMDDKLEKTKRHCPIRYYSMITVAKDRKIE